MVCTRAVMARFVGMGLFEDVAVRRIESLSQALGSLRMDSFREDFERRMVLNLI